MENKLAELSEETIKTRELLATLSSADANYSTAREEWLNVVGERDALLQQECAALTSRSGGAIRVQVKRYADPASFVAILRQALSGSRIQAAKFEALATAIVGSEDPKTLWLSIIDELEKLAEHDPERAPSEARAPIATLLANGLTAGDADRIIHTLELDSWLALSLTPIESVPFYEFRAREGEYIPFANASAGQQATALLKTLLNQQGPPLIIDQPEDDLDNPVMLEIVGQIWGAKQLRQIIFASHNANLVVNGDAELVAWFGYRTTGDQSRGMIKGEGAIDIPEAREAIKQIMEGGEAAFSLRHQKYGF
jgi:type III restriction enzyme